MTVTRSEVDASETGLLKPAPQAKIASIVGSGTSSMNSLTSEPKWEQGSGRNQPTVAVAPRRRVFRPSAIGIHYDGQSCSTGRSPSYGRFTTEHPGSRHLESSASGFFPSSDSTDCWGQLSFSGAFCSIVEISGSH